MKETTFSILAAFLISLGAVLAVWGVVLDNPRDYINASYIGSDRPGMILALSNPTLVNNYMRYRNKAFLSLVFIVLGFFVGLPTFSNRKISYKRIVLLVFAFFILSVFVTGRTRKIIIEKWNQSDCQINWIMKLLDESYYDSQYEKWKKTNQGSEFLENTMTHFEHIAIALDIDIYKDTSGSSLTPDHLDVVRRNVKSEVENKSIFYYLLNPKKLVKAYR